MNRKDSWHLETINYYLPPAVSSDKIDLKYIFIIYISACVNRPAGGLIWLCPSSPSCEFCILSMLTGLIAADGFIPMEQDWPAGGAGKNEREKKKESFRLLKQKSEMFTAIG